MNPQKLLDELTRRQLLTEELSADILKSAASSKKNPEDIIYERQIVSDVEIAKIKGELLGVPYRKIDTDAIPEDVLALVPQETALSYHVAPLERQGNVFVAGMLYPDDEKAQEALRFVAKRERLDLGAYLLSRSDFDRILRRYNPFENEIKSALQFVKPTARGAAAGGSAERKVVKLEESSGVAEEAPIIKIVASALKEAVIEGASDIHIEPQRERLRIRFRIDGDLKEVSSLPLELHQPIISRIKVLAELLIDETRRPQDGRFRTVVLGRDIDFRVATFPTPVGEKAALRVLDPTIGLKGFDDLGLSGINRTILEEGLAKPFGMVLITGPTGSGKTTTLYALLQTLNKEDVNIVSLEDPVEYFVDGLNQSQVRHDIGYTFASGLRQILRQDPDVIMVGEIRDAETAELAVHAALTGHIVLSTLHTNNAVGVIPRLVDMKVDTFLLPSALNLMAAQRLIVRLCDHCKEATEPSPDIASLIEKIMKGIPHELTADVPRPYTIYHPKGCDKCGGKGYKGRLAIFEVFKMTKELTDIIGSGINENKIMGEARRQGMLTLREDGMIKALKGLIPAEEVLRETAEE